MNTERPKRSATERAHRSREATKAAIARELLYAGILARIWPAFVILLPMGKTEKAEAWRAKFPYILCIESPAGWLAWKLDPEEYIAFDYLPKRKHNGERVTDRVPTLQALSEGW